MKIMLCIDYGLPVLTKEMKDIVNKYPFPECREKLVPYVESKGELLDEDNNFYRVGQSHYAIVDVDTSRPWHIIEYDGAESVQYLDYDVVDASMNYCQLRGGK